MARIEPFENFPYQYEDWFEDHKHIYVSELNAVRRLMPPVKNCVELGVGSGRFAAPLGIRRGLEPSVSMGKIAKERGIRVDRGVCERLPYGDSQFDLVLMVSTICFLDDMERSFREVHRILVDDGCIVIGFIEKNSAVGKQYREFRDENLFYGVADFYSLEELTGLLLQCGFGHMQFAQTIFHPLEDIKDPEPVFDGYGTGSFMVIRAQKQVI